MKRRIIKMAALAGVAALVFVLTAPAEASHTGGCGNHTFQSVLLGCDNHSTRTTQITVPTEGYSGLWVRATGNGSWGIRADGDAQGVHATGSDGVVGIATGGTGKGVYGQGDTGVQGVGSERGVLGSGGIGVYGQGTGESGIGVLGSGSGIAVYAESSGTALYVDGKAAFTRSGKTSIGAGLTRKDVSMSRLTSATLVTATLQGAPISGLWVQSVQVVPASNKFTIHLNKAVPSGRTATVGWFVVN